MSQPSGPIRRLLLRLSGRLTPPEALPDPDRLQRLLLPAADLIMIALWSRPPGGSLRTARVTAATIGLSAGLGLVAAGASLMLVLEGSSSGQPLMLFAAAPLAVVGLGCAVLTLFGIRQRRAIRRAAARL